MTPNFEHIPDCLKHQNQWLLWRYENKNGSKPTKVPYQPNGDYARTNDPSTWTTFEAVIGAYQTGGFDGIGYAFADDFVGIDLDSCKKNGEFEPWAEKILEQFNSTYAEVSPSGTGIHIICKGTPLATGEKKWKDPNYEKDAGVEAYNKGRYFCFTGNSISTNEITDCQPGLDWLYQEYFAEDHEEPDYARTDKGDVNLDVLREALEHIPADKYAEWIEVGMGLKSAGLDLQIWEEWSKKSSKYEPGLCEKKWNTFNKRKIKLGTVFHIAKQYGFKFPEYKTDWASPDSFGEMLSFDEIEGRPISTDFLPTWVKDYVDAVAAHTQVEPGAVAVLVLAVLAACIQQRFEVSVSPGYTEILSLWVFLALPPASRKSAVFQLLIAPVIEWEQEEAIRLQPAIAAQQTEIAVIKERIKELTKLAGKAEE